MSHNESKHVQTELSEDEYERFRTFAEEHGLSLEEAGHESVLEWIERQQQADPNDRAFTVLDELDSDRARRQHRRTHGPRTTSSTNGTGVTRPSRSPTTHPPRPDSDG
ncbi:hypothetical protein [Halomicrobium zhouii]|nr:hypothetical protein [Halomicrobium zhouii]